MATGTIQRPIPTSADVGAIARLGNIANVNPVTDLNDFVTGIALFNNSGGNTLTNFPYTTSEWAMVVSSGNGSNTSVQVAFDLFNNLTPRVRRKASNTWGSWAELTGAASDFKIYNSVTDIGLTSGSATLAAAYSALPDYSILIADNAEFASSQRPSDVGVYGHIRIEKGITGRGEIFCFGKSDSDWRMYLNNQNVPTGTWVKTDLRNGGTVTGALNVTGVITNTAAALYGIRMEHGEAGQGCAIRAKRTDTGTACYMGVGTGGVNHGLYTLTEGNGKWMTYSDGTTTYHQGYAGGIYTSSNANHTSSSVNYLIRVGSYSSGAAGYITFSTS